MAQQNASNAILSSSRAEHHASSTAAAAQQPRTWTWLLPTNRKLRNIEFIALRNLSITSSSPARKRGKTIDDEALPQSLKSPAKLVSLREQRALGHSRSSTDLRAVVEDAVIDSDKLSVAPLRPEEDNGSPGSKKEHGRSKSALTGSPTRPLHLKPRRRSTIEWHNATPQRRQERLEDAIKERMADVFFTLHVRNAEEPVYVSETVQQTMNPTFRRVDWSACGPDITRLDQMTLRIWANDGRKAWRQLLHLNMDMSALLYIGRSLDTLDRGLPESAVLIQLGDGVYTVPSGSLEDFMPHRPPVMRQSPTTHSRTLPTSSFDALLRLSKLDDSIQDALATRNHFYNELQRMLESNQAALNEREQVQEAEDRVKTINFAKRTVEKQLEKARKQQGERRASLNARRKLIAADLSSRKESSAKVKHIRDEFPNMREEHEIKKKAITNQRRRVCEELQQCYSIQQLPGKMLSFTMCGLHLPNAEDLDSEPPETVAAAFGYIAQILQLLSFYLQRPLTYPVNPTGSTSSIFDGVSILNTNKTLSSESAERTVRTYPLFSKGVPRFRYEYAVFLLNQDIRILLESEFSLRVLDIRQTLPNLKYLLYVATAGEGDLPSRKAGGIRGLMRAPMMSRDGSADSTSSGLSGLTLASNGKLGSNRSAADRLREISGKAG
ncbi:hypothetical protein AC579_5743 [Pseudocercospora musae]|uniref:Autophagy-related protein 14 n=1 Tax=Pseudocercospora musae TaxID=113226 RepID=A0A139IRL9_9PEZI|nr:hypothetical protein AC579_5743 [Pseudocercospora musae]